MRKPINEMKLVIPSRSANESFARSAVAAFIAQLDPAVDELADIRTAVSEAVTNCIVHAYPPSVFFIILIFGKKRFDINSLIFLIQIINKYAKKTSRKGSPNIFISYLFC